MMVLMFAFSNARKAMVTKDELFSVKRLYKILDRSTSARFPYLFIWNPCVATEVVFFICLRGLLKKSASFGSIKKKGICLSQ